MSKLIGMLKKAKNNNTLLWQTICYVSRLFSVKNQENVKCQECLLINSKIKAGHKTNSIILHGGILRRCRIIVNGTNSTVTIGKGCIINSTDIILYGDNAHCIIGENVTFNSFKSAGTGINVGSNTTLKIGDKSLFSNSIGMYTTDFHKIFDSSGKQVNNDADIIIGKHVWVGMRSLILKGSKIPDGCVVGAGAIISGEIKEENSVCVRNSSNIIRRKIWWEK